MKHVIYGLSDPTVNIVRYVGYTKHGLRRRLLGHLREYKKNTCHRHRWLRALVRKGLEPLIQELEIVNADNWQERERFWIKKLSGNRLVNSTDGGEGLVNPSKAVCRRISKTIKERYRRGEAVGKPHPKGWKHTAETRRKIGESIRTSKKWKRGIRNRQPAQLTEETRRKIGWAKGKKFSKEHRAKIGAALMGNKSWTGKHHTQEFKDALSERNRGNTWGRFKTGKQFSDEHKRNLSESLTGNPNLIRAATGRRKIVCEGERWRWLAVGSQLPQGWSFVRSQ